MAALRADLALARGDYAAAEQAYLAKVEEHRSSEALLRLGAYRAQTGLPDEADALFAEAIELASADRDYKRATLELQRGLLDLEHQRYPEAQAHYEAAAEYFSGWYLLEEHLAEIYCLQGECERSLPIYERVIEETESPELMGAYADALEELGRDEEAETWRTRADARFAALLEEFPEALGGHGLEYFLERGPAERALELAEANAELRADGEALTLLAEAQLGSEKVEEANATIDRLLETPYRTPSMLELAMRVREAAGANVDPLMTERQALMQRFASAEFVANVQRNLDEQTPER